VTAVLPPKTPADLGIETVSQDSTRALVQATGPLDHRGAGRLCSELEQHLAARRRFVRLDVRNLRVVDHEALALLGRTHERFLAERGTLVLTGVTDSFLEQVRSAGLASELFCVELSTLDIPTPN